MAVTLKRFRCFVALAEELHFGRAAERVFLSQPALSKRIALLEQDLGAIPFERSLRGVILTEAGRVLLSEVRLAREQVGRAERSVRRLQNETLPKLRLDLVGPAAHSLVREILKTLRATHPELVISLNELPIAAQLELLKNDLIDLTLLYAEDTPKTAFYPIFRDPVVLRLRSEHPLAQSTKVSLASLGDQTLASPHRIEPGHARLLSSLYARDVVPEVIEVTGVAAAFGLVASAAWYYLFADGPSFAGARNRCSLATWRSPNHPRGVFAGGGAGENSPNKLNCRYVDHFRRRTRGYQTRRCRRRRGARRDEGRRKTRRHPGAARRDLR